MTEKTNFPATYFAHDSILRIERLANLFAWIILGYYLVQALLAITVFILQVSRGIIPLPGFTEFIQQVLWMLQPSIPGFWNFVGLQAVGKILLIFLDIEDNTRRMARSANKEK